MPVLPILVHHFRSLCQRASLQTCKSLLTTLSMWRRDMESWSSSALLVNRRELASFIFPQLPGRNSWCCFYCSFRDCQKPPELELLQWEKKTKPAETQITFYSGSDCREVPQAIQLKWRRESFPWPELSRRVVERNRPSPFWLDLG